MPPVSQTLTGTTSQGSILLIEEYDALAAAIRSALRKFAPAHVTDVARSLTEAKTLAKKIKPDLFVIDFDPAFPGLSGFLQKMQDAHPDAKVLVIAGKIPREIAGESRSTGALQFVEKPFDLPDFGASVQALLGPWTESETSTPRGNLHDLGLADLLLAQCAGARTVALEIKNEAGKSGEIHARQGQLSHAETGKKSGADALSEMLAWREIDVREREKPRATSRTMAANWPDLLIDSFRQTRARQVKVPEVAPARPRAKTGKKIVVVDDTEMLLIFVEDVLMTSDPELQITTALNGISGLKEIQRAKPDLVLLDYSLPDINGDEVGRRLLQNDATAQIPILMMSGHVPEMSKAAATLENVVATIAKPFLSEALVTLVQQTLHEPPPPRKKAAPLRKPVESKPTSRLPTPVAKADVAKASAKSRAVPPPLPTPALQSHVEAPLLPEHPVPPPVQISLPMNTGPTPHAKEPPMPKVSPAPSPPPVPQPSRKVAPETGMLPPKFGTISTPVVSEGSNKVILGLFLDVVSVQLTPELRMGSIRAKPSSTEVSLHFASPAMHNTLSELGFQLGPVTLDAKGHIATVRLIPSKIPFKAAAMRNALTIGAVSVVALNLTKRVQLTPAADAPMTMRLVAHLEMAGVELSPTFQVAQLVLKNRNNTVRVTLNSQATGEAESGTACETLSVRLDHSGQIAELLLNPVR